MDFLKQIIIPEVKCEEVFLPVELTLVYFVQYYR